MLSQDTFEGFHRADFSSIDLASHVWLSLESLFCFHQCGVQCKQMCCAVPSCSVVFDFFVTPWTVATRPSVHADSSGSARMPEAMQASSRGISPNSRTQVSTLQTDSLIAEPPGKPSMSGSLDREEDLSPGILAHSGIPPPTARNITPVDREALFILVHPNHYGLFFMGQFLNFHFIQS